MLQTAYSQGHTAPSQAVGPAPDPLLSHLRWVALGCRAAARVDLFKACATLALDRDVARQAHAEVLMRSLPQALGRLPVFYRPGVADTSFDEDWLLRIVDRHRASDAGSVAFLLRSRVPDHARRNLGFLIAQISDAFVSV